MATTVLQGQTKDGNKKPVDVTSTVNVTTNNSRLYTHTDGKTYEYVGNDASGNRTYRDQTRVRG